MIKPNKEQKIQEVLTRNVEQAIDKNHLEQALRSGKKLRVKLGIDPTAPDLHLGHAIVLGKLRQFQNLGHKAVLIIGDFTGRIGDPSGKSKTRPPLTEKDIKVNLKTYLAQAGAIIDMKKAEVRFNSEWLKKLHGAELMRTLSMVSIQQILEREDFKKRLSEQVSIRGHEMLYPIMVAYDSVAVRADVELGGSDQTFNLLMGRQLMERMDMKPQDILTTVLLEGLDGGKKMSKSLGNYVGISEKPEEMYGKLMSMHDNMIIRYFRLATNLPEEEIKKYHDELHEGTNPKEIKQILARKIVALYHGDKAAKLAGEKWEKLFSQKETSGSDLPELKLKYKTISIIELVVASGVAKSNSEARRLVEQGGVKINDVTKNNPKEALSLKLGDVVRAGKKSYFKIK